MMLAFLLRIGDAVEGVEEAVAGIDDVQVGVEMVAERARAPPRLRPGASRPLSTKMHATCGPTARSSSAAVTDESTPPDRPQMTRCLPMRCRSSATVCSRNEPICHSPWQPQTS